MFSVRFSVRPPLLALSLLLCSLPAWAVYKCDSDGKVTYSDAACANGTTVAIDDARGVNSPTQTTAAKDKALRQRLDKSRAAEEKRVSRQREKQEREEARARLVAEKQKRKCAQLAQRKSWAEDDLRNAPVKTMEKARRKSQRAAENYRAECPA
ncbi:hypothetical protein DXT88_08040 [Herbaspirillum lusitanum]|uniref:hypothetical protein n=1 Tax=Herbaspirillum lusitanum TaxID=213312 RepID=UPI0022386E6D|nr:hypothetical protein [Herbaspirillum lusitanum]MCW5298127.1 hypothetical protein [Herbaspirillum lusitanum]